MRHSSAGALPSLTFVYNHRFSSSFWILFLFHPSQLKQRLCSVIIFCWVVYLHFTSWPICPSKISNRNHVSCVRCATHAIRSYLTQICKILAFVSFVHRLAIHKLQSRTKCWLMDKHEFEWKCRPTLSNKYRITAPELATILKSSRESHQALHYI